MPRQTLESPVDRLEDRVSELETLPARVTELGAQIAQLRVEMHAEFSTIRGELGELHAELSGIRGEGGEGMTLVGLRDELRAEFSAIRADLRQEIRDGDEETRRQMRVLFEEMVARIKVLDEGRRRKK